MAKGDRRVHGFRAKLQSARRLIGGNTNLPHQLFSVRPRAQSADFKYDQQSAARSRSAGAATRDRATLKAAGCSP